MSGFAWTLARTALRAILQLAILAVLARLLPAYDFGVLSAALVIIGFAQLFVELGLGPAIIQRADLEDAHLVAASAVSIGVGVLFGIGTFLGAGAIARGFQIPELAQVVPALSVLFPLAGLAIVPRALLQRRLAFDTLAKAELGASLVGNGLLTIPLAWAGLGMWSLIIGQMAELVIRNALYIRKAPVGWNAPLRWRYARDLLGYSSGTMVSQVGNYVAIQGANVVAGRMLGASALGVYGRANQFLMQPVNLFGTVVDQVLFPAMSKVKGDPEKLRRAYTFATSIIALITLPLSAVMIVLSPELIAIIMGPGWSTVVLPFQTLAATLLFRTSYKMSDSLTRAVGAVYRRAWRQWLYAAAVIAGTWAGARWGVSGIALGMSLAVVLNFFLMLQLSLALLGSGGGAMIAVHLRYAGLALVAGLLVYAVAAPMRAGGLPALAIAAAGGAAFGALMLALLRFAPALFGEELRWLLGVVRDRRRKPAPAPEPVG